MKFPLFGKYDGCKACNCQYDGYKAVTKHVTVIYMIMSAHTLAWPYKYYAYVYIYTCIYIYICIYNYVFVYVYVHVHVYVYVYVYVHVHVYVHIRGAACNQWGLWRVYLITKWTSRPVSCLVAQCIVIGARVIHRD